MRNSNWNKTHSTTVTDVHSDVDSSSLIYIWSTNSSGIVESNFATVFTNGGVVISPTGLTGDYYLWIIAKDTAGKVRIERSNVFKFNNTNPVVSGVTITSDNITKNTFRVVILGG